MTERRLAPVHRSKIARHVRFKITRRWGILHLATVCAELSNDTAKGAPDQAEEVARVVDGQSNRPRNPSPLPVPLPRLLELFASERLGCPAGAWLRRGLTAKLQALSRNWRQLWTRVRLGARVPPNRKQAPLCGFACVSNSGRQNWGSLADESTVEAAGAAPCAEQFLLRPTCQKGVRHCAPWHIRPCFLLALNVFKCNPLGDRETWPRKSCFACKPEKLFAQINSKHQPRRRAQRCCPARSIIPRDRFSRSRNRIFGDFAFLDSPCWRATGEAVADRLLLEPRSDRNHGCRLKSFYNPI